MPRQNFVDGVELVFTDMSSIAAQHEREIYDRIIYRMLGSQASGFFGSDFLASYVSSSSVSVAVGAGFYLDSTQTDPEPKYRPLYNSAASTQLVTTPDATHNRIDVVCVQAARINSLSATRNYEDPISHVITPETLVVETDWQVNFQVVAGTPGSSPAVPATPSGWVAVCQILVTAVSGISGASDVTDVRSILNGAFPLVTGSKASPQALVAGTAFVPSAFQSKQLAFIKGSGGAVTVTANPQIAAGTQVGQELTLIGGDDTNTVTYANGTGLDLNGGIVLDTNQVLRLVWDGTNWHETNRRA